MLINISGARLPRARYPRPSWNVTASLALPSKIFTPSVKLEVYLPTMSTSKVLQYLYSLDPSSPDFSRCLYCLIRKDEEEKYLSTLQGSELTRLIDFLDNVRSFPSTPSSL